MQVLITGGTGQIGRALCRELCQNGHKVCVLSRRPGAQQPLDGVVWSYWDGKTPKGWEDQVEQADAIVHLAGENIGALPWSPKRKQQLLQSRLVSGRAVVEAIRQAGRRPAVLLQASAIGVYGTSFDLTFTEESPRGTDFLGKLASAWEDSTGEVEEFGVRRVIIRTGLVLDPREGVMPKWLLPYRLWVGGPLGSGRQWQSWIHKDDEISAIRFLTEAPDASGPYNLTAPTPVPYRELGKTLARQIRRPYWLPAPAFILKLALGEMSTLVLDGQLVLPMRLAEAGFKFRFPELSGAVADLLGKYSRSDQG